MPSKRGGLYLWAQGQQWSAIEESDIEGESARSREFFSEEARRHVGLCADDVETHGRETHGVDELDACKIHVVL